jgi:hypothetical protein
VRVFDFLVELDEVNGLAFNELGLFACVDEDIWNGGCRIQIADGEAEVILTGALIFEVETQFMLFWKG